MNGTIFYYLEVTEQIKVEFLVALISLNAINKKTVHDLK